MGFFLASCTFMRVPDFFVYREIKTQNYKLASWQKKLNSNTPIRIYIEGDGHAFNHIGMPTSDPTPRGTFLRQIAFNDPHENVVYLARPCQFVKDKNCQQIDWTTGRFSKKVIDSMAQAVQKIASNHPIVLIGYSGGGLVSGLIIDQHPELKVIKWITLAGVLNHTKWTESLKLPPLKNSLDLKKMPNVEQHHYVGDKDEIVPFQLTQDITPKNITILSGATHTTGFDDYIHEIYE